MAILKLQDVFGPIGEVSVYERNGKMVVRKRRNNKSNKKSSPAQETGRKGFKAAVKWVGPIIPFIRLGFRNYLGYSLAYNAARAYLQMNAMKQVGEEWEIDPALAKVSAGPLPMAPGMTVALEPELGLVFTWNPDLEGRMSPRDQVLLLAYQPESQFILVDLHGPRRMEGRAVLKVPNGNEGIFHIYAAFLSEDRKTQSDSRYLGERAL